jgi:hypothetical protein
LLWNARNDYARPYVAMSTMKVQPAKYLYAAGTEKDAVAKVKAEYQQMAKARIEKAKTTPVAKAAVVHRKKNTKRMLPSTAALGATLKPAALH